MKKVREIQVLVGLHTYGLTEGGAGMLKISSIQRLFYVFMFLKALFLNGVNVMLFFLRLLFDYKKKLT